MKPTEISIFLIFFLVVDSTLSLNKIKLSMDFHCLSCWAFHCQCDCIVAYGYCLDPKCCIIFLFLTVPGFMLAL
jgi:hypothetical protein